MLFGVTFWLMIIFDIAAMFLSQFTCNI